MSDGEGLRLYTFETTNQAMWAEEVARDREIPAEVVSAPSEARSKCGLALRTPMAHAPALERAMDEEGVAFSVFTGS